MTALLAHLESRVRTLEEIAGKLDAVRVEIVSRYLPECPREFVGDLQELVNGLANTLADFRGGALRDAQNAVRDHEDDEELADRAEMRRDHMAGVL